MCKLEQKETNWPISEGIIKIRSVAREEEFSSLFLEKEFSRYPCYKPALSRKNELLKAFRRSDTRLALAIKDETEIIGFGLLEPPFPDERWARLGKGLMLEVSVFEVSRKWRSMGISTGILKHLVNSGKWEDSILYMVGYSWTWDLDGKGLDPMSYRDMLINIFYRQGFRRFQTNEPNVMLRPENLFMARLGESVPEDLKNRFKLLRFDLDRLQ